MTALLAFLIGGFVVLATGHNPLLAYRDIFNGAGLNWVFHPTTNVANTAAYNLSQTLLQTTTLILCGLAVAFAFRCGMFNIGGQGQYFIGLYVANWLGYDFAGMNPVPHILLAVGAATLAGALWAGIAGFLKATVGAHEVISTIMLNWIAIWIGEWVSATVDRSRTPRTRPPRSRTTSPTRRSCRCSGGAGAPGAARRVLRRARCARRLLADPQPHDARLRSAGGGLQPGRGRLRRHQREEEPLPGNGDLRRVRRPRGCARHDRLPVPLRAVRHPGLARSASSASPSRCSAGTPPSAPGSARSCSAPSSSGRRTASRRTSSSPSSPATSHTSSRGWSSSSSARTC